METWDLAGIDIKVGPAAKASVSYTVRDAGNVFCSDVRTYIYAAGELNPDTVVGKFLKTVWHYTLSKDFLYRFDSLLEFDRETNQGNIFFIKGTFCAVFIDCHTVTIICI